MKNLSYQTLKENDYQGFLLENPYNRILFGAAPEELFTGCLA